MALGMPSPRESCNIESKRVITRFTTPLHPLYCQAFRSAISAQDVLLYYGAMEYGAKPVALGVRSPRESYNIESDNFVRERGSYQNPPEHP